jgi:hypothetical protein
MSRTSTHFRLSTTAGRRRVLPVRAWLQAGAAAAAVGFALAGAGTASADDGTAARDSSSSARDSSSAARDSSTQSRVSASSSAPRASAVQATNRVGLSAVLRKPPAPGTGKALFNNTGRDKTDLQIYDARSKSGNVYLAINDPALVLWSKPRESNIFRTPEALEWGFPEWLRGASYNTNPDVWVKDTLKGVRPSLNTSPYGVFTPAFPTVKNDTSGGKDPGNNGDGVAVTRYFGLITKADRPPHPFSRAAGTQKNDLAAFREAFDSYNKLLSNLATIAPRNVASLGCDDKRCNSIALGGGNDVVMPGWIGNAEMKLESRIAICSRHYYLQ